MKKLLMVVSATLVMLGGCARQEDMPLPIDTMQVKLTEIDPPRHYYVTFTDVKTGKSYKERVSQHCDNYEQIKIGETYTVEYTTAQGADDKPYVRFLNLRTVFCPYPQKPAQL